MVVAGATDVCVNYRRPIRGGGRQPAILIGLEDRFDRGVGARTDVECPAAGGFEPFGAVAPGEPDDADARPEALFGMRALALDDLDQRLDFRTDLGGLPFDPLRRPISVALVARRHMLAHRRVLAVGR